MTEARFVTEPIIVPIGQMELMPEGIRGMVDWVRSRAPACVPDGLTDADTDETVARALFPHDGVEGDRVVSDNELLIELAGRGCYLSYGEKAGRKSNREYIENTQQGVIPHRCYDEETDVLTLDGWKPWPEVTMSDKLATRAPDGTIEYQLPVRLYEAPYSGRMYCVESMPVDLLVTPNHNMLVCTTSDREGRKRDRYELIEAQDLDRRSHCYVKDGTWTSGESLDKNLLRLIGFAIGDGYIRDKVPSVLRFHLKRERKISWLKNVCSGLGVELREESYDGYSVLMGEEHKSIFAKIYDDQGEKIIPEGIIRNADRQSLEALWEGLMQSDGHVSETAILYTSTSLKLLDQIQQLLLHIGVAGHIHKDGPARPHITVCRKNLRPEFNRGSTLPKTKWIEDWSGTVYCAEVPNHTLYVRRNGIPVWSGNSITYHAKMSFFIAGISRRVSHELIRNYVGADRDEEGAPSQQSTRYAENPGFYVTPPRYLEPDNEEMRVAFEAHCQENFEHYRHQIHADKGTYLERHQKPAKGIDYKRMLEAASGELIHSVETSFVWTTNPGALAKLFLERDNDAADLEFQRLARKWKRLCMQHWPNAFPQPHMREGL